MHILSTLLPALGLFAQLSVAAYTLRDDYGTTNSFFDKFNFFTDSDPTHGFVKYVDRSTASNNGLISTPGGSVYIGVDHKNVAQNPGRQSVRLEGTKTYTHGLVILDLAHMPGSVCGSWPAFWMLGSNWPNNGEIDIIEGVNDQVSNQMTLHTSSGCTIANTGFSGTLETTNCDIKAPGQSANSGCVIGDPSTQSYGSGFNAAGGGVYATEWTGSAINMWFWPRSRIPADITRGSPNPAGWGTPVARFAGGCDINSHFKDMQIVFDITFCGDWAGSVWPSSACHTKANSCEAYVSNNPAVFSETYWRINSLKVYQDGASKRDSTTGAGGNATATAAADTNADTESPRPSPVPRLSRMDRRNRYRVAQ